MDATTVEGTGPWRSATPDEELIACARGGDRVAFERLYRRHVGHVHGLCLRLTGRRDAAEDLAQDTFVAAWRALDRFEARSGFSTWLHRIAVNRMLDRRRGPDGRYAAATVPAEAAPEPAAEDTSAPIDLERAVAALPAGARDVLVLVGIYGYTHEQAAAMLGIAAGTCKAQLHRARALLSARLGQDGEHA